MASLNDRLADIDLWLSTQRQLVCSGCQGILFYPRGSANVCCAVCNTITLVPPPNLEVCQLLCGECRRMLTYVCGAASVSCSSCGTVNRVPASNQFTYIDCGNCRTTLMYSNGASSVKCAICHYVTVVSMPNEMFLFPDYSPNGMTNSATVSSTSTSMPQSPNQTVIVENPMSIDSNGNLVSNVVLGTITDKK
ncbi:PREDICTED: protein LSD1-like [Lupinus angustifolius]|uniref:protein LSD1-like n=1 Tax=Lupinus angustifolius TaxID=3871 RepID=UPI00092F88FA|nr:PREDICTED: protein LSD1-like [Lupinus angustifolius]XP_019463154.1 PREDICTED: protein LSD1-like [Lupinus angustifolius]